MNSLRRWLYRPKRSDPSLLAQFYFADEELNLIAAELDGFEGRKDPERCATLVNQLRACQARVLNTVSQIMDESIKDQRALRDFRVKFPDDVIQENLAGQLWFGAECLAAGSSIMNREVESTSMRPLARALTKNLDSLRTILREQCLRNVDEYTDLIKENLIIFDKLFAEFELRYVSAMVSVKTAHEYDMIQEITVLFSETVQRALTLGLLTQEMIDEYDPALMFTIPRLAIVSGVLIFKDGPLNPDNDPWNISEMFRPFQTLLLKIRELLSILTADELNTLERALCSQDEPSFLMSLEEKRKQAREERRKHKKEKKGSGKVKNNQEPSDGDNGSIESELTAKEIAERLEALALNFEASQNHIEDEDQTKDSASQTVCNNAKSEDMPSSSSQNDDATLENVNNSTDLQGLVSDIGCVEDLYNEVNQDSSNVISVLTSAYPTGDIMVQRIPTPSQFMNSNEQGQTNIDSNSSSTHPDFDNEESAFMRNKNSENNDEVLDRGQCSLNKCDSKDSGLQSEVVSNSGSMFTISSSDSNQQIISSDSIPTPSDQNSVDSSEDADSIESHTDRNRNLNTHFENSSDSSATIVSTVTLDKTRCEDDGDLKPEIANGVIKTECCSSLNPDLTQDSEAVETSQMCHPIICKTNGAGPEVSGDSINNGAQIKENNVDINVSNIHTDNPSFQDTECGSANSEKSGDSVLTVPVELPNTSAESLLDENSNHSHDASCDKPNAKLENEDKQLPKNGGVNGDFDHVSVDTLNDVCTGEEVSCSNSDAVESSIETEKLKDNNIVDCNTQDELSKQSIDCDSNAGASASCLQSEPFDLAIQDSKSSLSDSNCVNGECTSVTPQIDDSNVTTKSDHSSTQNEETPHCSDVASKADNVTNGTGATSSNNVKSGKGAHNVKTKTVSKKKGKNHERKGRRQENGSRRSRESRPVLCPHHAKMVMEVYYQLDSERNNSSDTSSYTSECGDEEEIALAIEAIESATRDHVRARFRSSSDMIHRLFVCISGVADQLQTNFAGDLRNILRCVFDMNGPEPMDACENEKPKDTTPLGAAYRAMSHASRTPRHRHSSLRRDPPAWLPDEQSNDCMACQVPFNFLRRRHHCRNCGKIFCGRCSSNFVPLPHFGQDKAVRICNRCFMFQVSPFTTE